jgi:hypothetical protein
MLLDAKSVEEASALLRRYPLLQANNLCFLTADGVYTEQFVPTESLECSIEKQVTRVNSKNDRFCQTNSIFSDEQVADGTKSSKSDIKRRDSLAEKINNIKATARNFEKFMMTEGRNKNETLSTVTFELIGKNMSGRAIHYFTGDEVKIAELEV